MREALTIFICQLNLPFYQNQTEAVSETGILISQQKINHSFTAHFHAGIVLAAFSNIISHRYA